MTRVVFRVDASPQAGLGHLVRCLSLAHAFRSRGASCRFVCLDDEALALVEREGFELHRLTSGAPATDVFSRDGADVLVTDSYAYAEPDKQAWATFAAMHLDLDDDARGGRRVADVVLNGNVYGDGARYEGPRVSLLGSVYAPLRPVFAAAKAASERRGVLVTMGGVDPPGATIDMVEALAHVPTADPVTVVVGPRFLHRERLDRALAAFPRKVQVLTDPDAERLARAFSGALLAVCAGGTTVLELAACATPALIWVLADNQVAVAKAFAARGAAVDLGRFERFDPQRFAKEVWAVLGDAARRRRMSEATRGLVDGQGADRVAQNVLGALTPGSVHLRAARADDARRVWQWRNDAQTRAQSLTTEEIPWETHAAWYDAALKDRRRRLLIVEGPQGACGILRIDMGTDGSAEANVNLAPEARGSGIGTRVLSKGTAFAHVGLGVGRVLARIRSSNAASLRAFEKCGYRQVEGGEVTLWAHDAT